MAVYAYSNICFKIRERLFFIDNIMNDIVRNGDITFINELLNKKKISDDHKYGFLNDESVNISLEEKNGQIDCSITIKNGPHNSDFYNVFKIVLKKSQNGKSGSEEQDKNGEGRCEYSDITVHFAQFNFVTDEKNDIYFQCGYVQRHFQRHSEISEHVMREVKNTLGISYCEIPNGRTIGVNLADFQCRANNISDSFFFGEPTGYKSYYRTLVRKDNNNALAEYLFNANALKYNHKTVYENRQLSHSQKPDIFLDKPGIIYDFTPVILVFNDVAVENNSWVCISKDGTYTVDSKSKAYSDGLLIKK